MAYDFSTRLDRLGTRMNEVNDNSLIYSRGTSQREIKSYSPTKIDVQELALSGIVLVKEKTQGFAFSTSELSKFDPPVPQAEDRITLYDSATATEKVFEIFNINDRSFQYTTSSRKRVIVNAKQIS